MTMTKLILASAACFVLTALPPAAVAQFAPGSGADTSVGADSAVTEGGVTTFRGQVDIRQGNARLLADEVVLYNRPGETGTLGLSGNGIDRFVATGNFYYITPEQEVRGDKGIYTAADNSFVVTGDVILVQDQNVVTGDRLVYNLDTEEAKVTSTCKSRKCPRRKRVSILIKSSGGQTN